MADAELEELSQELLYRLRLDLTPQQGFEAFEHQQLLAVRFHRAARINGPGMSEAKGWMRFFKEHFPRGDQYAELLWVRWRIALLKDAYPGPGVAISHGQAHGHWHVVNPGGLSRCAHSGGTSRGGVGRPGSIPQSPDSSPPEAFQKK